MGMLAPLKKQVELGAPPPNPESEIGATPR